MKPHFLNVDLEIRSKAKLDSIAAEMGARVLVSYCGPEQKRSFLAVESAREHKGPDATIHGLCAVVEALSPVARRIWNRARKVFDIGYELLPLESSCYFTLRPDTLERVAKLLEANHGELWINHDKDQSARIPKAPDYVE